MKRTKLRRQSRSPMKLIERRLDALASDRCQERDGHRCVRCGRTENEFVTLHAHHIIGRAQRRALRWYLPNLITLCSFSGGCHEWAHANVGEFHKWWPGKMGYDVLSDLEARARMLWRPSPQEYERIEKELRGA